MNRVALINVRFSPNLGDGLLAECLHDRLQAHLPNFEFVSLDLTGSSHFNKYTPDNLPRRRSRFYWVPTFLKKLIKITVMPYIYKKKWISHWKIELKDVQHIVIGGGHLMQDAELYYPTCINTVMNAALQDANIYIYGVGVSKSWSKRGYRMILDELSNRKVRWTTTRDETSKINWEKRFYHVDEVVFDPGLLAAKCYEFTEKTHHRGKQRPLIALGVSDPQDLKAHCEQASEVVYGTLSSWVALIKGISQVYDVMLFTNGATSDRYFLRKLLTGGKLDPVTLAPHLSVASSPQDPRDLIMQLRAADLIVSHRLHANIVAFSLNIPHIGFYWDRKILSFFEITGRTRYVVRRDNDEVSHVIELVRQALAEPIDAALHKRVLYKTDEAIGRLASRIKEVAQQ